jgi:transposase
MEVVHSRCAGLDVHARSITACVRIAAGTTVTYDQFTASTTTRGLLALQAWLTTHRCTHVAMEATGVYWKPVWHVLEEHFALVLANAMHIRNVPGRKSDANDAHWIADLLAHGLIRSSFIPPAPIQALRDLTRTRRQLGREIARHVQRIQKTLEDTNIKLTRMLTDIMGMSGRAILAAIVAGETDPNRLASLTRGRLKASPAEIHDALQGRVTEHHRFVMQLHLSQIDGLERAMAAIDARIAETLGPLRPAVSLLTTMPGLSETSARALLAEIGADMTRFPSSGHLVSWAGLCPRQDQSAGTTRSTRTRQSAPWLRPLLVNAAWSAARKKNSHLQAQFLRLKSRRGPKKAILAVAHSMLTAAYVMLRDGVEYQDLGPPHIEQRHKDRMTKRLLQKLRALGVAVEVKAA